MKKQLYIEAARGLAALIVVMAHFMMVFYPASIFGGQYRAHETWEPLFTTTPLGIFFAGQFAVCLFFILSGYVLSLPYLGLGARDNDHLLLAVVKRPFRLGGMVIASVLIAYIMLRAGVFLNTETAALTYSTPWFSQYGAPDQSGLKQFLFDIFTRPFAKGTHYNSPLWTIEIELYGSFITFGFLMIFKKSRF